MDDPVVTPISTKFTRPRTTLPVVGTNGSDQVRVHRFRDRGEHRTVGTEELQVARTSPG
jgi:hypothetical protein